MSYDLMVFKKESAPKTRHEFLLWYDIQTKWAENHSYDDPAITTIELNHWFMDMIKEFPAANGPFAIDSEDEELFVSDYCIGKDMIYVSFAWPVAQQAYNKMFELAGKHEVGFFDVSEDEGDVFFPENGELVVLSKPEDLNEITSDENNSKRPWWKFW